MKVLFSFLVALGFMTSSALALSCMPAAGAQSYARFDAAAESYVVVEGRIDFDWQSVPNQPPNGYKIKARMTGMLLKAGAFKTPFDAPVTLITRCAGPWCGGIAAGESYIAFLRQKAGGYELELEPCPGSVFGAADKKARRAILRCSRSGQCKPD